jgi:hypothetical protein
MGAFARLGMSVVPVPAMPTNLGTGSNEDRVIMVDSDEIDLHLDQPVIRLMPDVLSGNLQVRLQCYQLRSAPGHSAADCDGHPERDGIGWTADVLAVRSELGWGNGWSLA